MRNTTVPAVSWTHAGDIFPVEYCVCTHAQGNHARGPCTVVTCPCPSWTLDAVDFARRMDAWRARRRKE